jgi:hypothetical protein
MFGQISLQVFFLVYFGGHLGMHSLKIKLKKLKKRRQTNFGTATGTAVLTFGPS